ncbi:MAG: hypothetical protein M3277_09500, partial [Actinomycetota bacterium]|nr:hypothetical protein [Actinomycetota bacterium]
YLTGVTDLPGRACPRIELDCSLIVGTSFLGPASDHEMILRPRPSDDPVTRGRVRVSVCNPTQSGRGCPTQPTRSTADQLSIAWAGRGEVVLPVGAEVGRFDALTFRAGQNFEDPSNRNVREQDFDIALIDELGNESVVSAAAFGHALRRPEGPSNLQLTLSGTWIPLGAFSGIDLARVDRIELRFGDHHGTGSIQLLEVAFQRS